jgi:nucleoside-diphosphate-sugar epimerase
MNLVTVRPPMVIGNGTEPTLPAISFVREVLSGKEIQIYGDGLHEREYVSDTDVALGIWKAITWGLAAEHGYHPFFLTGNRISMRLLAEKVVQKFGGKVTYIPKTVQTFSLTTDPVDSKNLLSWGVEDDLDAILALVGRSFSSGDANV